MPSDKRMSPMLTTPSGNVDQFPVHAASSLSQLGYWSLVVSISLGSWRRFCRSVGPFKPKVKARVPTAVTTTHNRLYHGVLGVGETAGSADGDDGRFLRRAMRNRLL